jgi:hypothetical protein
MTLIQNIYLAFSFVETNKEALLLDMLNLE